MVHIRAFGKLPKPALFFFFQQGGQINFFHFCFNCSWRGTQEKRDPWLLEQMMEKLGSMTSSPASKILYPKICCIHSKLPAPPDWSWPTASCLWKHQWIKKDWKNKTKKHLKVCFPLHIPLLNSRLVFLQPLPPSVSDCSDWSPAGLLRYRAPITGRLCTHWPGDPQYPHCHLVSSC